MRISLHFIFRIILPVVFVLLFGACVTTTPQALLIQVNLEVDGQTLSSQVTAGSTVQTAIQTAGITLQDLDRVDPPLEALLSADGETITITRVREEFQVEEKTVPFDRQTVKNESLLAGETRLIQPGVNGTTQITYRAIYENGTQVTRSAIKSDVLVKPQPEIMMVGVQSPMVPISISGRLVYLTSGNAWMMEESSGNRKPLITSGDLDGRIFVLSPNGQWLLFTRKAGETSQDINTLWAAKIGSQVREVNLNVSNVIHYAEWAPVSELSIAYSTVEPRAAAPGWQANNDLHLLQLDSNGAIRSDRELVEANAGGVYGWWGMQYDFSPDGSRLAYAQPDAVGLVDLENGQLNPTLDIIPYQTQSEWAWIPALSWASNSQLLYIGYHEPQTGIDNQEFSTSFGLRTQLFPTQQIIPLASATGMFASPVAEPDSTGSGFRIAYLEAIFPERSDSSRYRLALIDQDGSNKTILYPPTGSAGLNPQTIHWSPVNDHGAESLLAVLVQGNILLINPSTLETHQITGDGSVSNLDWK